ncbi:unnamed protein product [Mytilus coruscus]|uniref:B box-type domain-containing protein n=1 Tax=Mytilus coruscus TaxID=42192 RepID=A0A6J8AFK1_MYTCO|nr:unnamed protein product [Mytilus coruscus]
MRLCLRQASADYKNELDKAYKDYEFRTENIIRETTSNDPNKLWKLLNDFGSHSSINKANIHIDVLYKYFEDIKKNTDYENDNVNLDFTAVSDNSITIAAKYCEPCTARGKTPAAFQWCTECEEALCSECTEAHKVKKMSRRHHLVEIVKIPNNINISHNLSKHHNLLFDYFCVDHDVLCCKEYLPKDHRACKNVTSIDIASKSSKQSQSFLDYEEQLSYILEKLNINRT